MTLPFGESDFLATFAAFNRALWPVIVLLWAVSAWASVSVARGRARPSLVTGLLAGHWLFSGLAYHAAYFARINPAARLFALVFVTQGVLFAWAAATGRLRFDWDASLRQVSGLAFLAASLVYPVVVLLSGHRFPAAPLWGVPCPTALFTVGSLLCVTTAVPRVLLPVPIGWCVIGGSAAVLLGMPADLLLFPGALSLMLLVLPDRVQRRLGHWWTGDADAERPMRSDALVPEPAYEMTLTRVIHANPEDVWPWLVQLGYQRGGLYSYDWLDRLFGYLDRPSATSLLPQFQQLRPGDVIPIGHGGGFPVKTVEPNRSLILGGEQEGARWAWEIALDPIARGRTRITSRSRGAVPHTLGARVFIALLGPAAFLMTRRMLIGLAARAEHLAGATSSA